MVSWEGAIRLVDLIVENCGELVELAESTDNAAMDEFATSVADKAESIGETIEQRQHVTTGQMTALQNMDVGVNNWLERQSR